MDSMETQQKINKIQNMIRRNMHKVPLDTFEMIQLPQSERSSMDNIFADGLKSPLLSGKEDESFGPDKESILLTMHRRDSFQDDVVKKSQDLNLGAQEAESEVMMERLVVMQGSKDKALLYVVSEIPNESKIQVLVNTLLRHGAKPYECDEEGRTALYHAVNNDYESITRRLLNSGAIPHARDKYGVLPYMLALDKLNDNNAALLLAFMPNDVVRALYTSDGTNTAELSFQDLVRSDMQQAKLGLLDCMIEAGPSNHYRVYFKILDCDTEGRAPPDPKFNAKSKSALHILTKSGQKDLIYHDVVRLLLRRKWKLYGQGRFSVSAVSFLVFLFALTFALVAASVTPNPLIYAGSLHYFRAIFELYTFLYISIHLCLELNLIRKHGRDYLKQPFYWLDMLAVTTMLLIVPFRLANVGFQWALFALGYIFWSLRIFKYAPLFRSTGALVQIIRTMLATDFVHFGLVFLATLLPFIGSFTLVLRYENNLNKHEETANFEWIFLTALRTLVEKQPVVEYAGRNGFGPLAVILMLVYLFLCLVVLLNILIAMLCNTYRNILKDAQRGLELSRAWIIMRIEMNALTIGKSFREKYYKDMEEFNDPREILRKWESPPFHDTAKDIQDIRDHMDVQDLSLRGINKQLAKQEATLVQMEQMLVELIKRTTIESESGSVGGDDQTDDVGTDTMDLQEETVTEMSVSPSYTEDTEGF